MELIFGIGNVVIGIIMSLIGLRVYNPFNGKNNSEKEEEWYDKNGTFFLIGGILMTLFGIFKVIANSY